MKSRRWPRPGHVLLLLPLVAVAAWVSWRAGRVREDPGHVLAALRATAGPVLPAAPAVGAATRSELERYDRETLYDFIDGAAESYLANGFERCVASVYTFREGPAEYEVAAEVYRFASEAGARAQLASERPAGAAEVPGSQGAVADASTLLAVRGRDFLKLTVVASGPGGEAALRAMAAAWLGEGT